MSGTNLLDCTAASVPCAVDGPDDGAMTELGPLHRDVLDFGDSGACAARGQRRTGSTARSAARPGRKAATAMPAIATAISGSSAATY